MYTQRFLCYNLTLKEATIDYGLYLQVDECPEPCVKMITYFGYPFLNEEAENTTGKVNLYFKNIVKITEDFVTYDLLR